jgi:hypothetical protein
MSGVAVDARLLQQARRVRALQQQQQRDHHSLPVVSDNFDDVVSASALPVMRATPPRHAKRTSRFLDEANGAAASASTNNNSNNNNNNSGTVSDALVREFALVDERQRRLRLNESAAAKEMIFREMADEGFQIRDAAHRERVLAAAAAAASSTATTASAPLVLGDDADPITLEAARRLLLLSAAPPSPPSSAPTSAAAAHGTTTFAEFELFGRRFVVPSPVMPEVVSDVVRRLLEWQHARRAGSMAADVAPMPAPTSDWYDDSRALRERLAVLLPPDARPSAAISSESLSPNDAPVLLLAELTRLLRRARNCAAHRASLRALHRRLDVIRTRLASAPDVDSSWTAVEPPNASPRGAAHRDADDASDDAAFVGLLVDVTLAMLEHVELVFIGEFPRLGMAEERLCYLRHVLERASIEAAHKQLTRHFATAHRATDDALALRYRDLRSALPGHLGVRPRFWLLDTTRLAPYRLAIGLLRLLPVCETPDAKLRCLLNAQTAVTTEVNEYWRLRLPHLADRSSNAADDAAAPSHAPPPPPLDASLMGCAPTRLPIRLAGDELLPLLSYIVLQARVPHLYAHLAFAADFLAKRRRGDVEGYCAVLFRSVAEYVSTLDENALERNIEEIRDELDRAAPRAAPPKPTTAAAAAALQQPPPPLSQPPPPPPPSSLDFDDADFSEQILPPLDDDDEQ